MFCEANLEAFSQVHRLRFEVPKNCQLNLSHPDNWNKVDFLVKGDDVQIVIGTRGAESATFHHFDVIQDCSKQVVTSLHLCCDFGRHAMYMRLLGESNKPGYLTHEMLIGIPAKKIDAKEDNEDTSVRTLREQKEEHDQIERGEIEANVSDIE
jgi:hypothetical protein